MTKFIIIDAILFIAWFSMAILKIFDIINWPWLYIIIILLVEVAFDAVIICIESYHNCWIKNIRFFKKYLDF